MAVMRGAKDKLKGPLKCEPLIKEFMKTGVDSALIRALQ